MAQINKFFNGLKNLPRRKQKKKKKAILPHQILKPTIQLYPVPVSNLQQI